MPDEKITQLSEQLTPALTDFVVIVHDPAGTPVNKKVTIGNIVTLASGVRVFEQASEPLDAVPGDIWIVTSS